MLALYASILHIFAKSQDFKILPQKFSRNGSYSNSYTSNIDREQDSFVFPLETLHKSYSLKELTEPW
jgi:hypothetical protein